MIGERPEHHGSSPAVCPRPGRSLDAGDRTGIRLLNDGIAAPASRGQLVIIKGDALNVAGLQDRVRGVYQDGVDRTAAASLSL